MAFEMKRGRVWALILVTFALLFGSCLRFDRIDQKLLWYDEIVTALWYSGHDLHVARPALANRVVGVDEFRQLLRIEPGSDIRDVIKGIVRDDPQHTPLYYVALRGWAELMGDSIGSLRSLSAVSDLLILPVLFWLCLELFGSATVAWIAVAMVAISPFHLVYSQEARPYTLWLLTITLASAILLWTLRNPRVWKWCLYALTLALGLYTHLLFCTVMLSHAVYVACLTSMHPDGEKRRALRDMASYAAATICALISFTPWVWVLVTHLSTAIRRVSWSGQEVDILHLLGMWAYNYSAVFLDTNHALKYIDEPGITVYGALALRVVALVPALFAVLKLLREPTRKPSQFLLPLIFLPFLVLAVPDLLLGGMRSGGGNRYLAASFLALQVAIAYWLATGLSGKVAWRRNLMKGTLAFILAMGVLSGIIFHHADSWWHKSIGHFNMDAAQTINRAAHPLLISPSPANLISISHSLNETVKILYVAGDNLPVIPADYSDVFILDPSQTMKDQLESIRGVNLEEVLPRADLYRFRGAMREPAAR
jgi:uncharacterized membrane protein